MHNVCLSAKYYRAIYNNGPEKQIPGITFDLDLRPFVIFLSTQSKIMDMQEKEELNEIRVRATKISNGIICHTCVLSFALRLSMKN